MGPASKVNMNNSISGVGNSGSFGQNSFYNKKNQPGGPLFASNKKIDKKKVLPVTKKFPELKLMINGEQRNHNNSLSSDEENFNVSRSDHILIYPWPFVVSLVYCCNIYLVTVIFIKLMHDFLLFVPVNSSHR